MRNAIDFWGWSPSRDTFGFTPVLDRFLEDVLEPESRRYHSSEVVTPACDVEETPTHFLISIDMPGISKENIQIEVKDEQLQVTAERSREKTESKGSRHWTERSYGKYHRAFTLGKSVRKDGIEAVYQDGVLRIALAKAEEVKPRQITVQSDDKSGLFAKLASKESKEEAKSLN